MCVCVRVGVGARGRGGVRVCEDGCGCVARPFRPGPLSRFPMALRWAPLASPRDPAPREGRDDGAEPEPDARQPAATGT